MRPDNIGNLANFTAEIYKYKKSNPNIDNTKNGHSFDVKFDNHHKGGLNESIHPKFLLSKN